MCLEFMGSGLIISIEPPVRLKSNAETKKKGTSFTLHFNGTSEMDTHIALVRRCVINIKKLDNRACKSM